MNECTLCGSKAVINRQDNASRTIYNCDLCGVYVVSDLVVHELGQHALEIAAFMMSRKLAKANDIVMISFEKANKDKDYVQLTVDQIVSWFPKTFSDSMDAALSNLIHHSSYAGEEIKVDNLEMAPLFYVKRKNYDALSYIIKYMQKCEYIDVNYYGASFFPCGIIVAPGGWDRYAEFSSGKTGRHTAFVSAGRQDGELSDIFRKAVKDAVKHSGLELVESTSSSADNTVNYELIANVKRSNFVVCDLANGSEEAYYAAGVAQALGRVTALTCHESGRKKLKVNGEQMNVIYWDTQKKLYLDLLNMIRAFVE